jgi:AraC-like DNA-binding protein
VEDDLVLHFDRLATIAGVRLLAVGWADLQPVRWDYRLFKPYWTLYFNRLEGAEIICGGASVPLKAGRAYLIPAWCPYRTFCRSPTRHLYIYLDIPGQSCAGRPSAARGAIEMPPAVDLAWLDEIAGSPARHLSALEEFRIIRATLTAIEPWMEAHRSASIRDPLLAPALRCMQRRLAKAVKVSDLAEACGMGEDAFTRRFKVATGITSVQYLRHLRVEHAISLLTGTTWAMERIAGACGFGNRTYLARVFREVVGNTPEGFRQALFLEGQNQPTSSPRRYRSAAAS